MEAVNLPTYTGEAGAVYFQHRLQRRSDDAQLHSARVFMPFVQPRSTVIDFGCGTGGILKYLACARRIGIEINEPSITEACRSGIEVHTSLSDVPSSSCDLAISHHALEHVPEPRLVIAELHRVLKPGGSLVIVVPCEMPRASAFRRWARKPDVHLYSWHPLSLGNLVHSCGFAVRDAHIVTGGYSRYIRRLEFVTPLFWLGEKLIAHMFGRLHTFCLASKPGAV